MPQQKRSGHRRWRPQPSDKILVACAVEVADGALGPDRICLSQVLIRQPPRLPRRQPRLWRHYQDRWLVRISRRRRLTDDPMSSVRWLDIGSCPGFTGSLATSRSEPWASTTGCAASTSNHTSMIRFSLQPPTYPARSAPSLLSIAAAHHPSRIALEART